MSTLSTLENPAERRKLVRLKVRSDLQITEQRYEGKVFHVVKDPVCLRYYRFNRQEYFVFALFDGTHTMEDIRVRFEDEYRPHRLEFHDLESFARQLVTAGLVQHETGGAGRHLFQRRLKQRRLRRFAAISNIMYWKIPVFDPDRILNWMYGYLWWIFTPLFFTLSVTLMLAAVFQVLVHFGTFYEKIPRYQEFFAAHNLLYMWISLGVVKVIHEFGHGLSCKAYGGESHEMGILLMCFSPALYCNVTDAWTVSDKWKRIIISFAGIYVELVIAAIATFVWWYTPHLATVNNIAMAVMVLCSVSTVFFNANPLMRFDGYYMLADWLEIPNLRDRANKYLTNLFLRVGLGVETPPEAYMAPGRKALFVVYAVASYVYRWVVTFSILWFLADFLGPRLKVLSQMLAIFSLMTMFIWPVYRMVKNVNQRGRLPDMKSKHVYTTSLLAALLVVLAVFLPLPVSRVRETAMVVLDPAYSTPVSLSQPGRLERLAVAEGQRVTRGQLIARFDSYELIDQRLGHAAELAAAEGEVRSYSESVASSPKESDQLGLELETARGKAEKFRKFLAQTDEQRARLQNQVAPQDGVVVGLPVQSELGKLFDRQAMQQKPVCMVGDPTKLLAKVPVGPTEYQLLSDDLLATGKLEVSFLVSGRTDRVFKGVVTSLPKSPAKQVPVTLTTRGGGSVSVQQAGEGGQETVPVSQTYLVEVELTDADESVKPGTLVAAKIHCRWRSAGWWVKHKLSEALDVGLYQ